jgi:hypothetical protein
MSTRQGPVSRTATPRTRAGPAPQGFFGRDREIVAGLEMYDSVGGEQAPHKERCRANHAFDNTHQPPRVLSPLTCIAIVQ